MCISLNPSLLIDLDETILAVGDGLTQPAAGIGDRQHGVIAAGTTGAARAGEGLISM